MTRVLVFLGILLAVAIFATALIFAPRVMVVIITLGLVYVLWIAAGWFKEDFCK